MSGKRTCPVCEKSVSVSETPHSPFCSARCKNVDLNRWLTGGYVIAGNATGDDSEGIEENDLDNTLDVDKNPTRH